MKVRNRLWEKGNNQQGTSILLVALLVGVLMGIASWAVDLGAFLSAGG